MHFTQNPIGSDDQLDLQDNAISFDYAMNSPAALWTDRFGKQHKTVQQALKDVGFKPAGFDFVTGGTLGIGDRDKCVFYPTDGYWYSWNGKLPYTIPANSSPTPGGSKGWKPVNLERCKKVSIKDWDDKAGSYGYICTVALELADQWCYENGKYLYFPEGQYCIDKSIIKKSRWVGDGAPELAPFPQNDDDKIYLRPGWKDKLPGTSIILISSDKLSTVTTVRSDIFNEMTYVVKSIERYPASITGMAIIMDMDVYDKDGNLTSPSNDNRKECDVGLLLDDSSAGDFNNLVVFGYWNKGGIVIWSHSIGDNPDYNKFSFGSTMGYYGLVLIGNDTPAGPGPGLSGTQSIGFQLFANDHHSRLPQILRKNQRNSYGHLLFIDGKTGALDADVNGHEFITGGFRTYSNTPVVLDNCSSLHLISVPFEFSTISAQQDTNNHKFIATVNTRNIHVKSCRNATYTLFNHDDFGKVVSRLMWEDPTYGNLLLGSEGAYISLSPQGTGGGPRINFTRNPNSTVSGTSILMDVGDNDKLKIKSSGVDIGCINGDVLELSKTKIRAVSYQRVSRTLKNNILSVPSEVSYVQLIGENSIADELVTIEGAPEIGQILVLKQGLSTSPITIKGTGNIRFYDNVDRTLDSLFKQLTLMWDGSFWVLSTF